MVYFPVDIKNKGTSKKRYLYRDTSGVVHAFHSAQIKSMWNGNKFYGVRLDSLGRLIEDAQAFNVPPGTPSLVQKAPVALTARGYKVFTGADLPPVVSGIAAGKKRRYAVQQILDRLSNYQFGKVCVVKGLRRTGKTTAILQAIDALLKKGTPPDRIGYITVTDSSATDEVINLMEHNRWEYVFVDEVTHLSGVLHQLKTVSDALALTKKIVLTGTDSYVWPMAAMDVLYGRQTPVDLTFMSFKEYCEVFPDRVHARSKTAAVERFCMYGGVLKEDEYVGLGNAYISLQTALVENIINTINRNKDHSTIQQHTGELYTATKEQLTEAVICAVLQACQTQGGETFKTSAVKIPDLAASILEKQGAFKASGTNQKVLARLMAALIELNVLDRVENFAKPSACVKPHGKAELTCHVSSLYNTIIGAVNPDSPLTGDAFENLILSQCVQFAKLMTHGYVAAGKVEDVTVGCCRYDVAPEFLGKNGEKNKTPEADVVVLHRNASGVVSRCVIEVKLDDASSGQAKNLVLPSMAEALGRIDRRIVVYTGETKTVNGVEYAHAYDFLMDIGKWVL